MTDADHRLLGVRDGIVSGMFVIRSEIGSVKSRLDSMPTHWTRRRAALLNTLAMLQRMDAELDHRRRETHEEWDRRKAVEIVSQNRPEPVNPF